MNDDPPTTPILERRELMRVGFFLAFCFVGSLSFVAITVGIWL